MRFVMYQTTQTSKLDQLFNKVYGILYALVNLLHAFDHVER
jgi:hypothetical protein